MKKLNNQHTRYLSIIGLVVVLLIVVWIFLPAPVQVEVGAVVRGPFEQRVIEDGKTQAKDIYHIYSPVHASMLRVPFKAGARVKEGERLVSMVPATSALLDVRAEQTLQARLDAAKAELKSAEVLAERAKVAFETATSDFKRNKALQKKGFVSESELEHIASDVGIKHREYESAKYNVEVAQHEVERSEAAIKRFKDQLLPQIKSGNVLELTSPVDGQIVRLLRESAGSVDAGEEIMQVADVRNLEVTVDLLSTDAVIVPYRATAWITRWGGEKPLKGVVRLVEPGGYTKISSLGVEEQRVDVLIDFVSPYEEWKSLGVGFQVDAEIVVYSTNDALLVPVSSLFRNGDKWAVFVVDNGRAKLTNIEISWRNPNYAVVEKGLKEGQKVIIYPGDRIYDGVRVRV